MCNNKIESRTKLQSVFSPLTSAEAFEKSSRWLWKESCVSIGVREPYTKRIGVTDRNDKTLAVKSGVKHQSNQPTNQLRCTYLDVNESEAFLKSVGI